jgi:hypothetical protein
MASVWHLVQFQFDSVSGEQAGALKLDEIRFAGSTPDTAELAAVARVLRGAPGAVTPTQVLFFGPRGAVGELRKTADQRSQDVE